MCIYYQNVRGLKSKIDDFYLAASESNYDVIVLTETWLDDSVYSTQLFGGLYTVFRTDRNHRNSRKTHGGGVLIAVSKSLTCCMELASVCDYVEHLWVRVKIGSSSLSIGVAYLPPDRKNDLSLIEGHVESVGAVCSRLKDEDSIILLGDYNQSSVYWKVLDNGNVEMDFSKSSLSEASATLLDGIYHGLTQMNTLTNYIHRTLDLVFGNECVQRNCSISEATFAS